MITLYTDGSCDKNGYENAKSGSGIWHKQGSRHNRAIKLTSDTHTSQKAEIMGIVHAIKGKEKRPITIKSDSKTNLEGIIKNLESWEDKDYLEIKNATEWKYLAYLLRSRRVPTMFEWVEAHSGIEDNEEANRMANLGQNKMKVKSQR